MAKRLAANRGVRRIILENGLIRYEARVHRAGEKPFSKRFKTLKEANEWKREIDNTIDTGGVFVKPNKITVNQVIDDYLVYRKKFNPLLPNRIYEFERVRLDLGHRFVTTLCRADLEDWLYLLQHENRTYTDGKVKPPYAPASARRLYYSLKAAVNWHCSEHRYYVSEFLFKLHKGTVPPAWAGIRERRLNEGEEERLYAFGIERKNTYTRADWENVIGFALETAMREQEITLARWQDLRQDCTKLYLPAAHCKSKKHRTVLLSRKARAIVESQRATCPTGSLRIFHQFPSATSLCDSFARLVERAGIENLHFHDLRHEATSRLCIGGQLSQFDLMEMCGHESLVTFQGYLNLIAHENSKILD